MCTKSDTVMKICSTCTLGSVLGAKIINILFEAVMKSERGVNTLMMGTGICSGSILFGKSRRCQVPALKV